MEQGKASFSVGELQMKEALDVALSNARGRRKLLGEKSLSENVELSRLQTH